MAWGKARGEGPLLTLLSELFFTGGRTLREPLVNLSLLLPVNLFIVLRFLPDSLLCLRRKMQV